MKYLSLLPLAGLAVAAPGNWQDDPVKETSTTSAAPTNTWEDVSDVTVTETATGTYCDKTGKLTKPAPAGGECTIDVTTVTVATATVTVGGGNGGNGGHGGNNGGNGGKATVTETATVTVTAGGNGGNGGHGGNGGKETVTVTTTVGGKDTVTKTVTEDCSSPTGTNGGHGGNGGNGGNGGKCLSDADAKKLTDNFSTLLEYTSYNGTKGAPGRGYKYDVSAATLATDFVDISDSINFMAGFPLGSVTFANKTAFDYGQGVLQPEVQVETLNVFHDCDSITWRWLITPFAGALPVTGINYMEVNKDGLLSKNYAEFDSGAWLQSFGQQCAINKPSVSPNKPATK